MAECATEAAPTLDPLYEFCRRLPKAELHAHLNGSLRDETVRALCCEAYGGPAQADDILGGDRALSKVWSLFALIQKLTNNERAIRRVAREVVEDFAADGVRYAEIRTTPRANAETRMTKESYVEAVLAGFADAAGAGVDCEARLILSIDRRQPPAEAGTRWRWPPASGTAASSASTSAATPRRPRPGPAPARRAPGANAGHWARQAGDFASFAEALSEGRRRGLRSTLHFAEVYRPAEALAMLAWGPDRLGHGNFLDAELLAAMRARPVPLEVCPTSNVLTGSVPSYADHHFASFHAEGYPLAICTDDKGVFRTSLSREYALLGAACGTPPAALAALAARSVEYAFLPDPDRARLAARFRAELPAT
eukprot:tig00000663_g2970.t2